MRKILIMLSFLISNLTRKMIFAKELTHAIHQIQSYNDVVVNDYIGPVIGPNAEALNDDLPPIEALSDEVMDIPEAEHLSLFVCGISLTSGQLVNELFPDCTRSCFSQVLLCPRGGDRIYEMRCLFVAVGPNARFIVLPHWDNMS